MRTRTENCYLLSSVSLLVLAAQALPSAAQDSGTFLGTIEIGQGKRDVRTGTAEAVTTVDAEEIADRQAGTVAELIDAVPGVNLVNGSTPTGSGINIRGYGATGTYGTDQKVLIQIDGATRGSEELYRIGNQLFTDPYLYREVEVLRGTVGSFEYGSGVVGGVVRLETIDASDMTGGDIGFRLRESLEFQSNGNGLTNSTTLAWQPTEGLELLGNYTRRTIGVQQDGDGNAINAEAGDSDLPSWLLKGRYMFGQDSAHALTFSYTDTRQDESDVPYDSFGQVDFGNVDRTTRSRTASLRYEYDPSSPMIDLDVTLAHSDEEITNDPIDPFGSPLLDADHRYQTTTFRVANTASPQTGAIGHDLRTGVEYIRRDRLDAYSAPVA